MKEKIKMWLDRNITTDVKLGVVVVAAGVVIYKVWSEIDKYKTYKKAADYYAQRDYAKARGLFRDLGDYKLSSDYRVLCTAALGEDYDENEFEDDDIFGEEF